MPPAIRILQRGPNPFLIGDFVCPNTKGDLGRHEAMENMMLGHEDKLSACESYLLLLLRSLKCIRIT